MTVTWHFHTPYDEATVNRFAPTTGGVYLLWVQLQSEKWRCFYVGKAENLEERLLDHLSENEPNKCISDMVENYSCGFEYAQITSASDRSGVEKFLYNHYSPKCNKNDPGGTPTPVNLP